MKSLESGFKTRKELAKEYNICVSTFDFYISPIRIKLKPGKPKRLYNPTEVQIVREYLSSIQADSIVLDIHAV